MLASSMSGARKSLRVADPVADRMRRFETGVVCKGKQNRLPYVVRIRQLLRHSENASDAQDSGKFCHRGRLVRDLAEHGDQEEKGEYTRAKRQFRTAGTYEVRRRFAETLPDLVQHRELEVEAHEPSRGADLLYRLLGNPPRAGADLEGAHALRQAAALEDTVAT